MTGNTRRWLVGAVLTLALAPPVGAGPLWKGKACDGADCPPPSYSCLHYVAPALYRCRAFHTPPQHLHAHVLYPEFVRDRVVRYPCPAVDPAVHAATSSAQTSPREAR
jgi:hypothetical protein